MRAEAFRTGSASSRTYVGKTVRELVGELLRSHAPAWRSPSGDEVTFASSQASARGTPMAQGDLRAAAKSERRGGWLRRAGVDISAQKQADAAREALVSNLERTVAFAERFVEFSGTICEIHCSPSAPRLTC